MKINTNAFTLVELVIVIIILGVLSSVGFVSYTNYISGSRDANRVTQIRDIYKGLQLYGANKRLPYPDNYITVTASGTTIGYQGYAGEGTLKTIKYANGGKDPKDKAYFTYFLSKDKKKIQVLGFLEEQNNLQKSVAHIQNPYVSQSYATDLSNRYPKTTGASLGILLNDATNIPIQDTNTGEMDVVLSGDIYEVVMSDTASFSGSGTSLSFLETQVSIGYIGNSCKSILETKGYLQGEDGVYLIHPDGQSPTVVYCDMTTDGGGWSMVINGLDGDIANYDSRGDSSWISGSSTILFASTDTSFKLSDSIIKSIRNDGKYMIKATNLSGSDTYYVKSTCDYNHELGNNGDCAKIYYDIDFFSALSCGGNGGRRGIGCRGGGGVIFNHSATSNILCYNGGGRRCTNAGHDIELQLYVR